MKKKTKKAPVVKRIKRPQGTKVLGQVHLHYVQTNFPESEAMSVAEALSQVLLNDYYRQFCTPKDGDAY